MNANELLGAAAGLLVASGLLTLAWAPVLPSLHGWYDVVSRRLEVSGRRLGAATIVGLGTLALVRLPVLGIAAAAGVIWLPGVLGGRRASRAKIERLLALESWVRRLGDLIAAHAGLEQAITSSAAHPPAALQKEIRGLASRLSATMPIEEALWAFADELDDPAADTVVAAFLLSCRRRGPALTGVLRGLSASLAEDVAARQSIEADREKPRSTARVLTWFVVAAVAFVMLDANFRRPYESASGQVVLAAAFGFLAVCFVWMWRTADSPTGGRFLTERAQR
jgi:Flp pilus assembly protein TadB